MILNNKQLSRSILSVSREPNVRTCYFFFHYIKPSCPKTKWHWEHKKCIPTSFTTSKHSRETHVYKHTTSIQAANMTDNWTSNKLSDALPPTLSLPRRDGPLPPLPRYTTLFYHFTKWALPCSASKHYLHRMWSDEEVWTHHTLTDYEGHAALRHL